LVVAEGMIHRGKSQFDWTGTPTSIGSDSFLQAIRQAVDDKNVKGLLIRVVSGGGSYIASDMIAHEIKRARERGKKVVVSMGAVAASGGYYISMYADKIVCLPSTVTGSIGVIAAKVDLREMWKKIGITFDYIHTTANGSMFSSVSDNDNPDYKRFVKSSLDHIYQDFTSKVQEARHLTPEQIEKLARGRVWIGTDAFTFGLVDKLGGLDEALDTLKHELLLKSSDSISLKYYPWNSFYWQFLFKPQNSEDDKSCSSFFFSSLLFCYFKFGFSFSSIITCWFSFSFYIW